jgi:hypothetical protein
MPLTPGEVAAARCGEGPTRRFDAKGLYLLLAPSGGKYWRFKYRFDRRDKRLALGTYPEVSLADARKRRDEARSILAQGNDPATIKRELKARARFERLAKKNLSRVEVRAGIDGTIEIWKGNAFVQLTAEEAYGTRRLLNQLTGEQEHAPIGQLDPQSEVRC